GGVGVGKGARAGGGDGRGSGGEGGSPSHAKALVAGISVAPETSRRPPINRRRSREETAGDERDENATRGSGRDRPCEPGTPSGRRPGGGARDRRSRRRVVGLAGAGIPPGEPLPVFRGQAVCAGHDPDPYLPAAPPRPTA